MKGRRFVAISSLWMWGMPDILYRLVLMLVLFLWSGSLQGPMGVFEYLFCFTFPPCFSSFIRLFSCLVHVNGKPNLIASFLIYFFFSFKNGSFASFFDQVVTKLASAPTRVPVCNGRYELSLYLKRKNPRHKVGHFPILPSGFLRLGCGPLCDCSGERFQASRSSACARQAPSPSQWILKQTDWSLVKMADVMMDDCVLMLHSKSEGINRPLCTRPSNHSALQD